MNYVESQSEGEDDDEEIFQPSRMRSRITKRQKTSVDSEDEFEADGGDEDFDDDGKLSWTGEV